MSYQSLSLHGAIKNAYALARWYVKRARTHPYMQADSIRTINL